nr:helix-turn-helix domain-containing protein [Acetobacter persici]
MHDTDILVPKGPFVTRKEAAEIHLRCHVKTIDRYVAAGRLPKYKFGRKTLFLLADVLALIKCVGVLPPISGRGRACAPFLSLDMVTFIALSVATLWITFFLLH